MAAYWIVICSNRISSGFFSCISSIISNVSSGRYFEKNPWVSAFLFPIGPPGPPIFPTAFLFPIGAPPNEVELVLELFSFNLFKLPQSARLLVF